MSTFVDPSWAATEEGQSSKFDINTRCDFDIDTATAQKYSRDAEELKKGAKLPPGDKGAGRDKFWDDQAKDDEFRKAEQNLDVFRNFARSLNVLILGSKSDKFLQALNKFLKDLNDFRMALIENHFPI